MTSTVRHNVLQNVVFWLSISGVFLKAVVVLWLFGAAGLSRLF